MYRSVSNWFPASPQLKAREIGHRTNSRVRITGCRRHNTHLLIPAYIHIRRVLRTTSIDRPWWPAVRTFTFPDNRPLPDRNLLGLGLGLSVVAVSLGFLSRRVSVIPITPRRTTWYTTVTEYEINNVSEISSQQVQFSPRQHWYNLNVEITLTLLPEMLQEQRHCTESVYSAVSTAQRI